MPTPTIQSGYISADSIEALTEVRFREREASEALLRMRERQMDIGDYNTQPVDALSTGYRVIDARDTCGENSPEHQQANQALIKDCHRLVAEWRRKNKPEYFPPTHHKQDPVSGEYIADGHSIRQINQDGLVPTAYPEEDARRINENVEEVTAMHARRLGGFVLGQTIRMRTISGCAQWSIDGYKRDGKSRGGYVPEIEKRMIRDIVIDPQTGDRFQEQVGLPSTFINDFVVEEALRRRQFDASGMDKTDLHGTQLFTEDDVFDFVALLDEVASEEWRTEVFMGEEVPKGYVKDYEAFKREAVERQKLLESDARMVSDFVLSLCEGDTNPNVAPDLVEEFVKQLLITKSQEDLSITTEMFDDDTASGLWEVQRLRQQGEYERAQERLVEVIAQAPGGGFCGAGSCDLERAKVTGEEADRIKELGFDPKDTLVDKGERKCKCGKKSVVYDLKQKIKGCTSCGATKKY